MFAPSTSLAGMMLVTGVLLVGSGLRNILAPPPHYQPVNMRLAAIMQWLAVIAGAALLTGGITMGIAVMKIIAECPPAG